MRGLATQSRKQNIKLGTATKASCCAQSLLAEWSLACEPYTLTNIIYIIKIELINLRSAYEEGPIAVKVKKLAVSEGVLELGLKVYSYSN